MEPSTVNEQAIRLFLGGLVLGLFSCGLTVGGYTNKWLARLLFACAGMLALLAIFWPQIAPNLATDIVSTASQVASNSWVWFGTFAFTVSVLVTGSILKEASRHSDATSPPKESNWPPAQAAPQPAEDKIFIDVTPEYLMGLYDGRLHAEGQRLAEPYIGKWVKWSGALSDFRSGGGARSLATFQPSPLKLIYMWSDTPEWIARLSVSKVGDRITVSGEIATLDLFRIELNNCELVH